MLTRGCLLGLLSVPATWLLAAALAFMLSGSPEPEISPQLPAIAGDEPAAGTARAGGGTLPAARNGGEAMVRPVPVAPEPADAYSRAVQQCSRFILDLMRAPGGDSNDRRPSACSRAIALWTRGTMSHLAAVLGPLAAWTRFHALLSGQSTCADRTVG